MDKNTTECLFYKSDHLSIMLSILFVFSRVPELTPTCDNSNCTEEFHPLIDIQLWTGFVSDPLEPHECRAIIALQR